MSAINHALEIAETELQIFLRSKFSISGGEKKTTITAIVDESGKIIIPTNSVGISLINIEEERINPLPRSSTVSNERIEFQERPIRLNLYVLFSANFNDYGEALKFISAVIAFFQSKPVFTKKNTTNLNADVDKLSFEIFTQNLEQIKDVWSFIGGRYLPSVLYRIRGVVIDEQNVSYFRQETKDLSSQSASGGA